MRNSKKIQFSLCLMFFNLLSYGNSENYDNDFFSDPGFPGGDPAAPIDDYIIPAMIMMALYVFYKQHYKKHKTQ